MPAPQKWIHLGYSPLHSQILAMFDQLEEKNHNCWFDNLYLSAKFARASFTHKNKVRISGPTRKSGRGLPQCVLQEEKMSPSEIRQVRGTVKAPVLEGDSEMPDLVAVSYWLLFPTIIGNQCTFSPPYVNPLDGFSVRKRCTVSRQIRWRT